MQAINNENDIYEAMGQYELLLEANIKEYLGSLKYSNSTESKKRLATIYGYIEKIYKEIDKLSEYGKNKFISYCFFNKFLKDFSSRIDQEEDVNKENILKSEYFKIRSSVEHYSEMNNLFTRYGIERFLLMSSDFLIKIEKSKNDDYKHLSYLLEKREELGKLLLNYLEEQTGSKSNIMNVDVSIYAQVLDIQAEIIDKQFGVESECAKNNNEKNTQFWKSFTQSRINKNKSFIHIGAYSSYDNGAGKPLRRATLKIKDVVDYYLHYIEKVGGIEGIYALGDILAVRENSESQESFINERFGKYYEKNNLNVNIEDSNNGFKMSIVEPSIKYVNQLDLIQNIWAGKSIIRAYYDLFHTFIEKLAEFSNGKLEIDQSHIYLNCIDKSNEVKNTFKNLVIHIIDNEGLKISQNGYKNGLDPTGEKYMEWIKDVYEDISGFLEYSTIKDELIKSQCEVVKKVKIAKKSLPKKF